MDNFKNNLNQFRLSKRMTQENLAIQCGLSRRQLIRYEQGESEPTLSVLITLADFFDVSLDELVGRAYPNKK